MISNKAMRVILDTNIYGLVLEKNAREEFYELIKNSNAIIYGCSIVRKELRETPKKEYVTTDSGNKKLRIALLNFYDTITKDKLIDVDERTVDLANKFLNRFSEITKQTVIGHLKNDFMLVACACLNNLDLIVSEDHKTLLSKEAIRAYHFVSVIEGLKIPNLFTYEELKQLLRGGLLDKRP